MKVLYFGHYREGTGWSQAAIDYMLSMDRCGIDVVCRNFQLTDRLYDVPEKIVEMEQKDLNNVDYCVQHVLPHHLVHTNKFKKNIAFFVTESNTTKFSPWYNHLKNMDYVWVPNNQNKSVLINDGLSEERIKIIPHTFDMSQYTNIRKKINLYSANNRFKFYYIGELNDRKNISSILRCFYSEFTNGENVCLVLKIKKHGADPEALRDQFLKAAGSMKEKLRIHKRPEYYPPEIILTAEADDDVISDIHYTCDCYVSPSHGEAWSIPAFEAMCYGKTPICSNEGGPKEFIDQDDKNTGTLINGVLGVCSHTDPAFPEIFTGREEWFMPSEKEIKQAMRWYYENRDNIDRSAGLKRGSNFSYEAVGQKIKDVLDE